MWLHGKYGFWNQSTSSLERWSFLTKDLGCSPVTRFSDIWPQHKSPPKYFIKRIAKYVLFVSVRFISPRFGIPKVTHTPQKMHRGSSAWKYISLSLPPRYSRYPHNCSPVYQYSSLASDLHFLFTERLSCRFLLDIPFPFLFYPYSYHIIAHFTQNVPSRQRL